MNKELTPPADWESYFTLLEQRVWIKRRWSSGFSNSGSWGRCKVPVPPVWLRPSLQVRFCFSYVFRTNRIVQPRVLGDKNCKICMSARHVRHKSAAFKCHRAAPLLFVAIAVKLKTKKSSVHATYLLDFTRLHCRLCKYLHRRHTLLTCGRSAFQIGLCPGPSVLAGEDGSGTRECERGETERKTASVTVKAVSQAAEAPNRKFSIMMRRVSNTVCVWDSKEGLLR